MTISVTIETETIRCFDKGWKDIQKPPYRGVVTIRYLGNGVATASGACGKFTAGDIKAIYQRLADNRVHTMIADRGTNHRLPHGVIITDGLFAGWFQVDLTRH